MSTQMKEEAATQAPRLVNPGADGWAQEPKVTQPETLLFGELAGAVRLLGQAAVAAQDAYSLVCKHSNDDLLPEPEREEPFWRESVQATWQLYENARAVHREIANKAVAHARQFERS